MVAISLVTKAPEKSQLEFTYSQATDADKAATKASWNYWDVIHSIIILAIIVAFYAYFW
jgi:SSS family solute:Na+ symporter